VDAVTAAASNLERAYPAVAIGNQQCWAFNGLCLYMERCLFVGDVWRPGAADIGSGRIDPVGL